MKKLITSLIILLAAAISGCATQKPTPYDWSAFQTASPSSILIVPVLNKTIDVDAPLYALSTLSIPLGEKGYYVFPVNTVKTTLEQEGLYEGEAIKQLGTPTLVNMFGADAVLYVEIQKWEANYAILSTTVTVSVDYLLEDSQGNKIWSESVTTAYSPQNNNSGGDPLANLIASAISAAITRADPNYIPLMIQANNRAFITGHSALPPGPYARVDKK
ncbi:DUF799 domain-containing protein [Dasania marina]|uniref:DUF799 domain-containing protein n=1 Tax=Dasania marina TaxID=471499 RepID=UPI000362DFB0|nr:GNA1162 family protein [Dasania marina]